MTRATACRSLGSVDDERRRRALVDKSKKLATVEEVGGFGEEAAAFLADEQLQTVASTLHPGV